MVREIEHKIFGVDPAGFSSLALDICRFQLRENAFYRQYADTLFTEAGRNPLVSRLPFLPVSFFKQQKLVSGSFEPELLFESSGTTGQIPSRHWVKSAGLYQESFLRAFRLFYGDPSEYCILALLPSYLERQHSSLVYMAEALIRASNQPGGGFFLHNWSDLRRQLEWNEAQQRKTLLLGVSFALLDFAELHPMPLPHTILMETGGMKGRREEWTRSQLHQFLQEAFQPAGIHSEYGMTELLSQAYAREQGRFYCPPWMRVLVREEDDPLTVHDASELAPGTSVEGLINIIDLANLYSCSFLATDDVGWLHADGSFEVMGRRDHSDLRGCSLLVANT